MERKVGEIFEIKNRKYKVVKDEMQGRRCAINCSLHDLPCWDMEKQTGPCSKENRKDYNDVIFKKVTKVNHINDITDPEFPETQMPWEQ